MKKVLLALPLFLVVGLLFVELPVGNSSPKHVLPSTSAPTPVAEPLQTTAANPQNFGLSKPAKSKIEISGGKKPKHSNDDENESGEHEGFGEDDD